MKVRRKPLAALALAAVLGIPAASGAVDISQLPISAKSQATPNVIFGVDDSGSMDWEVLSAADGGQYYWSDTYQYPVYGGFFDSKGKIRSSGNNGYAYLFPNGYSSADTADVKKYNADTSYGAIPPTPEFGFTRSAQYNPMYYNPAITYVPWKPAWIDSALRTFTDADPTAARSHPYFPTSGTPVTIDLTQTLYRETTYWSFRMRKGMKLGGISGVRTRSVGGSTWTSRSSTWTASGSVEAAIPYFPATYWAVDATCTAATPECSTAPDGRKLRRIEIKPGVFAGDIFPSGRTYAQEIRNFANWFQYYRKRKLLLSAAMASSLAELQGIRGGVSYFNQNASSNVTMYDFGSDIDSLNGRAVLGLIYKNRSESGTPTGTKLDFIGRQFKRTDASAPVQFACQRNAAFVLTDGYANGGNPTPPSYAAATWHGSRPYTTIFDDSLADIAASYYTNNLRPDLTTGLLSVDPSDMSPNADKNTDLHMQTFAITMGALGTIYGQNSASARNPFVDPPTWPTPVGDKPSSIDDLWHATINGRGDMYAAFNAEEVTYAMQEVVRKILVAAGSDAGIAVSTVNLREGDNTAFVSSYNARNWTGDIAAYPIDIVNGNVDTSTGKEMWSAQALLDARAASSRIIASHDGTSGVTFTESGLGSLVGTLSLDGTDGADVLAWLRGERGQEGTYRVRAHVLGDIVTAEPVYNDGVVYQAANDGMLHAFDADTGAELWAYVPYNALDNLGRLAHPDYEHRFHVDGTPSLATIDGGARTILVGGLRGGGAGYYALDVTDPRPATESTLASKVLWEFPNASTPAAMRDKIGSSFGKPVIAKTTGAGWVVLLTSGYNNVAGTGHLFVLDAVTGSLLATLDTPSGFGLAQLAAWVDDPAPSEPIVDTAYGGDLGGNVWRFDLRGTVASWSVKLLVALGATKPITSAPDLVRVDGKRFVLFGSGRLLGETDLASTTVQSVYGVIDSGTTIVSPATRLFRQTLTEAAGGIRHVSNTAIDWTLYDGWRFDLPAGERVSSDPSVAFGALVFTSNKPSAAACSTESFLYAVSVSTGGQMPPNPHVTSQWSGRRLGFAFSSRPVTVTLPSGKVVAITHKSDTTVASSQLPVGGTATLRRLGWREVFR